MAVFLYQNFRKKEKNMKQHIKLSKTQVNKGVLDCSHLLDAPAGKHGFLQIKDDHFYFEDGTRARFLGFNIAARSNTPSHELAEKLADHFASMGVNIIRMHAADAPIGQEECTWSSCKEAPLLKYSEGSSIEFNPEGLDRFDYLAAKLKEKGIYLHFDLLIARQFLAGDGLEYPGDMVPCIKCFPMFNQRLIDLQRDYAKKFLCHVNPYTGLAYKDDPAVAVVQMNNEDSAIKGIDEVDQNPQLLPYMEEVQRRFNYFLLMKYDNREKLARAWTSDGVCALREDEDPAKNTVKMVRGSFYQPTNNAWDDWAGDVSPARYADYMEFGLWSNRRFYREYKNYLLSLGVKVPIAASNLIAGAADVYGHIDGDFMENNTYFNHPILPVYGRTFMTGRPSESVSVNPLTVQKYIGQMATTLLSLGSVSCVEGKPFMITEWNDYGLHPFRSTSFVQMIAYACLNDWDGLILYNHHTSDKDNQPDDEIHDVFDCYNDPAVMCQWGFMANVFLKGLVAKSNVKVEQVFSMEDLETLPNWYAMVNLIAPYITGLRAAFVENGHKYRGDADLAINAGYFNTADLSEAKHAVQFAWSKDRDAFRRFPDDQRLPKASKGCLEEDAKIYLDEKNLVIRDIRQMAGMGDYTEFAEKLDQAMKCWKLIPEDTGLVDGKLISATGEICFDPAHARFEVHTPYAAYFSGAPEENVVLDDRILVKACNDRISLSVMPLYQEERDKMKLADANEFVISAFGRCGNDDNVISDGPEYAPGITMTCITMNGKLYAETLEGSMIIKAQNKAVLEFLDTEGNVISSVEKAAKNGQVVFDLPGNVASVFYHLWMD